MKPLKPASFFTVPGCTAAPLCRKLFLDKPPPFVFLFLHVRLHPAPRTNHGPRSAPGHPSHARRTRPCPRPRPDPHPADPAEDRRLARLPTEEEIAAEVRRRPVGAVIVDICRDLGIAPGHLDRAFWDEINHAIMMYGGSLARFFTNLHERLFACFTSEHSGRADPGWPVAPPRLPAAATGPP
jgi:hypothetical protein